jgi:hypothetical protein
MSGARGLSFRPATSPFVMRDATLGGRPVLVLGHWVDAKGREVSAEVVTMAQPRRVTDLRPFSPAPAFQPFGDDGR